MYSRILVFVCLFCFLGLGCAETKKVSTKPVVSTLSAAQLKPFGRTAFGNDGLALISSAAHVGFRFGGDSCVITATVPPWLQHNYLQVELDGQYVSRLRVSSQAGAPLVVRAKGPGTHTVWLYKATEAHTGPVFIRQIEGAHIEALQRPSLPLIEFIGNSITCGAAADPSEVPCGTGFYHDQHNAYMAYGPRLARALKTNFLLSSVSGIGVYRNWNSDGPTMPQVYEKLDFQEKTASRWNFSAYRPAIVSIALGTNDFSRGDGKRERLPFDSARYVNAYIRFVQQVKANYPAAKIALLSSPMINGAARERLQNCLVAVKAGVEAAQPGAKPIAIFFFQPMQASGCSGHPSVAEHGKMADELLPFFRNLLP